MNAEEAVKAAKLFDKATIIPLHYEGWGHFAQSYGDVERAFEKVGLLHRLERI
jgi:L-ascorbate metabolism protein UlaG (beta-lactamase superfamily)